MSRPSPKQQAFDALQTILYRHAPPLTVTVNEPEYYSLDTRHIMKNRKPLFFGAVRISKTYVSYHLMPVYTNPALLDGISPALAKRQQGKSCFNFKEPDAACFAELKKLTRAGYEDYVRQGYI